MITLSLFKFHHKGDLTELSVIGSWIYSFTLFQIKLYNEGKGKVPSRLTDLFLWAWDLLDLSTESPESQETTQSSEN